MHEAGIEIVLVVTIVNNVNNDQVGAIVNSRWRTQENRLRQLPAGFFHRPRRRYHPERRLRQRYTLRILRKTSASR